MTDKQLEIINKRLFEGSPEIGSIIKLMNKVYELMEKGGYLKSCNCRDDIITAVRQQLPQEKPEEFKKYLEARDKCKLCFGTGWINGGRVNVNRE